LSIIKIKQTLNKYAHNLTLRLSIKRVGHQ
jgi:hypothetical protein